jgi:hypothetical protein
MNVRKHPLLRSQCTVPGSLAAMCVSRHLPKPRLSLDAAQHRHFYRYSQPARFRGRAQHLHLWLDDRAPFRWRAFTAAAAPTSGSRLQPMAARPGPTAICRESRFMRAETNSAASDAAVAYDALHGVWLISTLPIGNNTSVAVSRSTDGIDWGNPITVTGSAGSPTRTGSSATTRHQSLLRPLLFGVGQHQQRRRDQMSTSTDGGQTWGPALATATNDFGIGGVPVVKPSGKVIVPILGFNGDVIAFTSTNGGKSWTKAVNVASLYQPRRSGGSSVARAWSRRPSTRLARCTCSGRIAASARTARRMTSCTARQQRGRNGRRSSAFRSTPVTSTVDHFITGAAIAAARREPRRISGSSYYYYPVSNCGNTCSLNVGFIQSSTAGKTWTTAKASAVR